MHMCSQVVCLAEGGLTNAPPWRQKRDHGNKRSLPWILMLVSNSAFPQTC